MEDLFASVTLLFVLGLIVGLVGFTFLYKKVDIPGCLKSAFRLNTRVKTAFFIILFGVMLALCLALLMDVLRVSEPAMQVAEGISVGFMCSMLPTLLGTKAGGGGGSGTDANQKRSNQGGTSRGGRRSKG